MVHTRTNVADLPGPILTTSNSDVTLQQEFLHLARKVPPQIKTELGIAVVRAFTSLVVSDIEVIMAV